jgi:hypothetical protein
MRPLMAVMPVLLMRCARLSGRWKESFWNSFLTTALESIGRFPSSWMSPVGPPFASNNRLILDKICCEDRFRVSDYLALGIFRQRQRGAVVHSVVPVRSRHHDRVLGGCRSKASAQRRVFRVGLVSRCILPLRHRHPMAGRYMGICLPIVIVFPPWCRSKTRAPQGNRNFGIRTSSPKATQPRKTKIRAVYSAAVL